MDKGLGRVSSTHEQSSPRQAKEEFAPEVIGPACPATSLPSNEEGLLRLFFREAGQRCLEPAGHTFRRKFERDLSADRFGQGTLNQPCAETLPDRRSDGCTAALAPQEHEGRSFFSLLEGPGHSHDPGVRGKRAMPGSPVATEPDVRFRSENEWIYRPKLDA